MYFWLREQYGQLGHILVSFIADQHCASRPHIGCNSTHMNMSRIWKVHFVTPRSYGSAVLHVLAMEISILPAKTYDNKASITVLQQHQWPTQR